MMLQSTLPSPPSAAPEFEPLCFERLEWPTASDVPADIKIFDLERLCRGEDQDELRNTLCSSRPFYIRNFGIEESAIESMFNITREFFSAPEEEKRRMVHSELPPILRGYSSYGTRAYENSINNGSAINQYTKYAWGPVNNVAPHAKFAAVYEQMLADLARIAERLLDCIGEALDLKQHDQWHNLFQGEDTVLHCQCYYPERALNSSGRMATHADTSSITLLTQLPAKSGHVGLRVETEAGVLGVPPIRGTMVVLVGETLNSLTHGRVPPVMHAVIGPDIDIHASERSSMPFFVNPRNAFRMHRPPSTTHGKFYNSTGETTFGDYALNIARAYDASCKAP